eukprot:3767587-Pyramimonas_sp.AAC.1
MSLIRAIRPGLVSGWAVGAAQSVNIYVHDDFFQGWEERGAKRKRAIHCFPTAGYGTASLRGRGANRRGPRRQLARPSG